MTPPLVNITIPVYNEAHVLESSVKTLLAFLLRCPQWRYEVVIANNGSTDATLATAKRLAGTHPIVKVMHFDVKGRGGAVKEAWACSQADILSYMDVDLSTDLEAFPSLISPLQSDAYDLAIGSRLLDSALTKRGLKREAISRGYNLLVKLLFHTRFSDAQCGFKAITSDAAKALLPLIRDRGWFMDTELLLKAEKSGYRIFDLAVSWKDDPDSRVRILRTAWDDILGLLRVRRELKTCCQISKKGSSIKGSCQRKK